MSKTAVAQPWDRTPGESSKAHDAFLAYRDLGPSRSLAKIGRALGKSTTWMEVLSSKWDWPARAAAYDDHMAAIQADSAEAAARRAAERRARRQEDAAERTYRSSRLALALAVGKARVVDPGTRKARPDLDLDVHQAKAAIQGIEIANRLLAEYSGLGATLDGLRRSESDAASAPAAYSPKVLAAVWEAVAKVQAEEDGGGYDPPPEDDGGA